MKIKQEPPHLTDSTSRPHLKWGAGGAGCAYIFSIATIATGLTFFSGFMAAASLGCFVKALPPGTKNLFKYFKGDL